MTLFLTIPGMKREKIIIPDNATLADFCRRAFEQTGVSLFNGFGYKSQNGNGYLVPTEAVIAKQTPFIAAVSTLAAPALPTTGTTSAGALGATTYYVQTTYVDINGESVPSAEKTQAAGANVVLTVTSPGASGGATGWNVYVGNTATGASGSETRQNTLPIAIGTNFQEPNAGLVAGANPPSKTESLINMSFSTAASNVFNSGDEIQVFNVPLGG